MDYSTPYPWQNDAWERLIELARRKPSGILIHGPAGIGKTELAKHLARSLVCENPAADGHPCGQCAACLWSARGGHPDVVLVRPETVQLAEGLENADDSDAEAGQSEEEAGPTRARRAPSKEIRIEQVRALGDALSVGSYRGGARVVVLYPAEALNLPAANALLKVLEEPPAGTLFVLVANRPERLPATVVSRCQRVALCEPPAALALAWLEAHQVTDAAVLLARCGGAPLAAAASVDEQEQEALRRSLLEALAAPARFSPLRSAERIAAVEPVVVVGWLLRWIHDCISYRLAGRIRYHPMESSRLAAIVPDMEPARLLAYQRYLLAQRRVAEHPLNKRLFAESLLLGYRDATQGR